MKTEFVIVIEADNVRASAAYQRGLADLAVIWPQIEQYCSAYYAKGVERYEAWKAENEPKRVAQETAQKEYDEALARFRKWAESGSIFKGPAPELPAYPYSIPSALDQDYWRLPKNPMSYFESVRNELQKMANVAGAALGPYRMTEDQVQEMVAWENGRRIESLKRMIAEVPA